MSDFKKSSNEEQSANKIPATSNAKASAENTTQLIQQRKENIYNMEIPRKYAKLAGYSACQDEVCKCIGWTPLPKDAHHTIELEPSYFPEFNELCSSCGHDMQTHILHLLGISNAEMTELLNTIVDMENLHKTTMGTQDLDKKMVYGYLVERLRHSISSREQIVIPENVGKPPFESPCISKVIFSFLLYKYGHLNDDQFNLMSEVCQTFLNFLNSYILDVPSKQPADVSIINYKLCYIRWSVCCRIPMFTTSLPQFKACFAFGRIFLRTLFPQLSKLLKEYSIKERNSFPVEKIKILTQMPKFLDDLKVEILIDDSPIWDINYRPSVNKLVPWEHYLAKNHHNNTTQKY